MSRYVKPEILYPGNWIKFVYNGEIKVGRIREIEEDGTLSVSYLGEGGLWGARIKVETVIKKYPIFMVWPISGKEEA